MLFDERVCPDDAMVADCCAVQNGRAHADQTLMANLAGVNNRAVANRAVAADFYSQFVCEVHEREILNVRAFADLDKINIAAQDCAVPHTALRTERNVAHHGRASGNKCRATRVRLFSQVTRQSFVNIHSATLKRLRVRAKFGHATSKPLEFPKIYLERES